MAKEKTRSPILKRQELNFFSCLWREREPLFLERQNLWRQLDENTFLKLELHFKGDRSSRLRISLHISFHDIESKKKGLWPLMYMDDIHIFSSPHIRMLL